MATLNSASPGGDWLNDNFAEIENTLRRFTVALSAAVDPEAYREEYLKKLYKLLDVSGEKDPLSYFAKYSAGELPRAALKSFVRQAQAERKVKSGKADAEEYDKLAAIHQELGLEPPQRAASASTTASHPEGRGRPHDPTGRYAIVARSDQAAYGRTGGPAPNYQFRFNMQNLEDQGHGRYVLQAWAARNSVDPADYIVVDTTQYADAAQGGTVDVATDRPAPQPAGGEFTGNWLIRAEDGTVLHRFGGIGNSQADANRTALAWAQRNPALIRLYDNGRGFDEGVAEARKNPEQNTKYQSGWAELAAWAHKNNVWLKPHEWAISMTYVPKLGINPGPGISEDTPRGIYFYPFHWAYSVKMDKEALPWADNAPYIQLFQYSTGTELYDPNQIPLASAVAQLKNYGITDEDIAAEKENYPSISTYNLLVWCLGRKYDDNKRVSILNKVLRNLGYDYMIDNGKGWIAINEPTQGVVLNPKIIDKVVTFNNYTRKKEQDIEENFADGKNPGRKGLAKRVGVNTKASVSDLRKTAKNSSGEKQRMSHWLANMKAGRAKAKRK
jgi:hypothetical protein